MATIVTYRIARAAGGVVTAHRLEGDDIRVLAMRLDLYNHSPTGFEYGYGGSGPAQLALAILADYLDDDKIAALMHQDFKWDVIAHWDRDRASHAITSGEIAAWLSRPTVAKRRTQYEVRLGRIHPSLAEMS